MERPTVSVAVQGGGAHGAFSWGVLDRLLDEVAAGRLDIAALSGSSAGAFNAALAAYGLGKAPGPAGARAAQDALKAFWLGDAHLSAFSVYSTTAQAWHYTTGSWNIDDSPTVLSVDLASQLLSPYVMPRVEWLKLALARAIDFAELRRQTAGPALYVTATNIRHNRRDIFARSAVSYDVLAASACIPTVFEARPMVVEGSLEYYWDGGFMGNPSLTPLLDHAGDLILVQVNCFERPDTPPRSVSAIQNRLNEVTFNAALVLELSTLHALNTEASRRGERPLNLHAIQDQAYMASLGYASKLVILREFLEEQHGRGWEAADRWLDGPGRDLGRRSTIDEAILAHVVTRPRIIRQHPGEPPQAPQGPNGRPAGAAAAPGGGSGGGGGEAGGPGQPQMTRT